MGLPSLRRYPCEELDARDSRVRWLPPSIRSRSAPAIGYRGKNVCGEYCTSHQQNAHITDSRVILYPWHPWYGKTALIFTSVAKTGQAVFRCGLESAQTDRPLEVPQWMFDATACRQACLAASPTVHCEGLLELKRLLMSAKITPDKAVLKAEHCSLSDTGGIDAPEEKPATGHPTQSFPPELEDAAVVELADGSSRTDCASAGAPIAPTPSPIARRSRRAGGVR